LHTTRDTLRLGAVAAAVRGVERHSQGCEAVAVVPAAPEAKVAGLADAAKTAAPMVEGSDRRRGSLSNCTSQDGRRCLHCCKRCRIGMVDPLAVVAVAVVAAPAAKAAVAACSASNHCKSESQTHCRSVHRWRGDCRTRIGRGEAASTVARAAARWAEVATPCSARSRCRWAHPISSDRTKQVHLNACKPLHTPVDTMEVEAWAAVAAVVAMEMEAWVAVAAAALAATVVMAVAARGAASVEPVGSVAMVVRRVDCSARSHCR